MSWLQEQTTELLSRIKEAKSLDVYPYFRQFQKVGPRVWIDGKQFINFTSNDYLGLSQDPRLIEAAKKGAERYGTGLGSSRIQATTDRHVELEKRLAEWYGFPACAVFTTGYQSLVGLISTFAEAKSTWILDNLSHASILDGTFLAQGTYGEELEVRFFRHNSPKGLRRTLKTSEFEKRLVVIEGVYSLDGDLAPLDEFVAAAKEFHAPIIVDDAHGMGTLGATGKGIIEHFGLTHHDVDFLVGTFSKSFGGVGGFVLGDEGLIEYMKNTARSFVFSASLPIPIVEAMLTSLDIMTHDFTLLNKLKENETMMRDGLKTLGFDLGMSNTHIMPIILRDESKTMEFGAWLQELGVIMIPILYPAVRHGEERLRCNITAAHTKQDIGMTLEILEFVGKKLGVIPHSSHGHFRKRERALWATQEVAKRVKDIRPRHIQKIGSFLTKEVNRRWEVIRNGTEPHLDAEDTMKLRRHFHRKNIILTGGSSGIGRSLAFKLAELGANLFLVARRQEPLDQMLKDLERYRQHDDQIWEVFSADISKREEIEKTLDDIAKRHEPDILINNAGIAYANYFEETDPDIFEKMMNVNYLGTVWATRAILPYFKKRHRGHIVNMSSIAGLIGIFGYSAYTPSKFALMGFSDVLRNELKASNIKISVVLPPDTDTPQLEEENKTKPPETAMLSGTSGLMQPDDVALMIIRGIAAERFHIVPGLNNKLPYLSAHWIPKIMRWFLDREVLSFQRKKENSQES